MDISSLGHSSYQSLQALDDDPSAGTPLTLSHTWKNDKWLNLTNKQLQNEWAQRRRTAGLMYRCVKCQKCYNRKENLSRHLRYECGVEAQFICFICGKKSKRKEHLQSHMRTHRIDSNIYK